MTEVIGILGFAVLFAIFGLLRGRVQEPKGCSGCDGLVSVAPNGDVLPCSSCADSVGNLLQEDFSAIWDSPKAVNYRVKGLAHPDCKQCEHFAACNGACPLYWQHLGFEELASHTV